LIQREERYSQNFRWQTNECTEAADYKDEASASPDLCSDEIHTPTATFAYFVVLVTHKGNEIEREPPENA
jgi:hypothetical protein